MDFMSEWETCEECNGSGVYELCDFCMMDEEDFRI